MDPKVYAGSLTCLKYLVLKLFLNLGHNFLDTRRVDSSVNDKLVQGESGNFPADRIERGKKNGVRCVVNHDLDTCGSLKGTDITSLTTDNPSLDLIVLDRECRHGVLDGGLGGRSLDGVDDDSLGLLGSVQASLVHRVVDVGLSLGPRLSLHILNKNVLGFLRAHSGDRLKLLVGLGAESFIFLSLLGQGLLLGLETRLGVVSVTHLPLKLGILLVQRVLLLLDPVLGVLELAVFLVDVLLVLALELEELLPGLMDLVLLDSLGFDLGLGDDLVLLPFQNYFLNDYVSRQRDYSADQDSYKKLQHNINKYFKCSNIPLYVTVAVLPCPSTASPVTVRRKKTTDSPERKLIDRLRNIKKKPLAACQKS